jgi:hypothetical protein
VNDQRFSDHRHATDVDLIRRLRAGAEAPDPHALVEQSSALLRRLADAIRA